MYRRLNIYEKLSWYISLLALLIIPTHVGSTIGLGNNIVTVSNIFIAIYIIYMTFKGVYRFEEIDLIKKIILVLGLVVLLFLSKGYDSFKYFLTFGILPFVIYSYMDKMSDEESNILRSLVILLFLTECLLAIYERVTLTNLLVPPESENLESVYFFRSTALYGHPIRNAMNTSCMLLFILASNIRDKFKLLFFVLGFLAILCFNTRGSIIIGLLCSMPFLVKIFSKGGRSTKIIFVFFIIVFLYFLINLKDSGLGGRLFMMDLGTKDSSSMARYDALFAFSVLSDYQILWGGTDMVDIVCSRLNIPYLENGPLSFFLHYGLVFGIPMFVLFVISQYTLLKEYSLKDKLIFLFLFHSVGFTNPSLTMPIMWEIFFFSYYAFKPKHINPLNLLIDALVTIKILRLLNNYSFKSTTN